ncbi:MAG: hypothetical protein ACO24D_17555, partial [bacterium]
PITTLGPDEMGFSNPGEIPHAIGPKPWHRNYLIEALHGLPPRQADKVYWSYSDFPIKVVSKFKLRIKSIELRVSSLIGRFYRRS